MSWKQKLPWLLLSLAPFGWWQWQVRAWGLPSDVSFAWPGLLQLFVRAGVIVAAIFKEMLNWHNWYMVWMIWWVNVIIQFSSICKSTSSTPGHKMAGVRLRVSFAKSSEITKILLLVSTGYMGVYLLSTLDPVTYVGSSIDRVMLQWLPVWWVLLVHVRMKT